MEKKTYESPSLNVHGNVEDITRDTMPEMTPQSLEEAHHTFSG